MTDTEKVRVQEDPNAYLGPSRHTAAKLPRRHNNGAQRNDQGSRPESPSISFLLNSIPGLGNTIGQHLNTRGGSGRDPPTASGTPRRKPSKNQAHRATTKRTRPRIRAGGVLRGDHDHGLVTGRTSGSRLHTACSDPGRRPDPQGTPGGTAPTLPLPQFRCCSRRTTLPST